MTISLAEPNSAGWAQATCFSTPYRYAPDMVEVIHVDERKWPGLPHWQFDALRLGEDEFGGWFHVPGSTVARRGHEPPRQLKTGFVLLVPGDEWWIVEFYWDHLWHELYVNIGTPPVWDGNRVTQIDLDLDVARTIDGSVVILDEDEFLHYQVELDYPPDVIARARKAVDRAVSMARERKEPFGDAAQRWIEAACGE